jgi:toll-interacting protein
MNFTSTRPMTFAGGQLPEDFLRIMVPVEVPVTAGPAYSQFGGGGGVMRGAGYGAGAGVGMMMLQQGTVTIHITQARLSRNYGMTRMDPAVHLTIAGLQARTAVCPNGGKTPYWNQRLVFPGVRIAEQRVKVEIYDIGTFSDTLVAWGQIDITPAMVGDGGMEEWFPLSGKEGAEKEGVLHMHISCKPEGAPQPQMFQQPNPYQQPMYQPQQPVYQQQQQLYPQQQQQQFQPPQHLPAAQYPHQQPAPHLPQQPPAQQPQQPADVSQLKAMFPDLDEETLRDVLVSKQGNVEAALEVLLGMMG